MWNLIFELFLHYFLADLVCPELYCGEIHDYTAEYEDGNNWTTV